MHAKALCGKEQMIKSIRAWQAHCRFSLLLEQVRALHMQNTVCVNQTTEIYRINGKLRHYSNSPCLTVVQHMRNLDSTVSFVRARARANEFIRLDKRNHLSFVWNKANSVWHDQKKQNNEKKDWCDYWINWEFKWWSRTIVDDMDACEMCGNSQCK